jgi:hypothetical protein
MSPAAGARLPVGDCDSRSKFAGLPIRSKPAHNVHRQRVAPSLGAVSIAGCRFANRSGHLIAAATDAAAARPEHQRRRGSPGLMQSEKAALYVGADRAVMPLLRSSSQAAGIAHSRNAGTGAEVLAGLPSRHLVVDRSGSIGPYALAAARSGALGGVIVPDAAGTGSPCRRSCCRWRWANQLADPRHVLRVVQLRRDLPVPSRGVLDVSVGGFNHCGGPIPRFHLRNDVGPVPVSLVRWMATGLVGGCLSGPRAGLA